MALQGSGRIALLCLVVSALFGVAFSAQTCSVLLASNRGLSNCLDLPKLGSTLAYTVRNDTTTIDFAFSGSAPNANGWVGWGINPTAPTMVGTQALIAYMIAGVPTVNDYAITGAMKSGSPCIPGTLSVNFTDTTSEIVGTDITIYTTLLGATSLTLNHVWNRGASVDTTTLAVSPHEYSGESVESMAPVTLATGTSGGSGTVASVELPNQKLKNNHGIISAVAWGLLLPLGIMAARYIRPFSGSNPAWFYIHVICQCTGYVLGVIAWALGMRLHALNEGMVPTKHRNLGISIFALATLQVLALVLRPNPDHKYRKYWNVYHHSVGYATIVLIIINIFEGLDLLQPADKWTTIYIIVLSVLGAISLIMEIITWILWLVQRSETKEAAMHGGQFKAYRTGHAEDVEA